MIYKINYCILLFGLILLNQVAFGQRGYIQEEKIKTSGVTNAIQVITLPDSQKIITRDYTDGLGRIIQKIVVKGSPLKKDIVTSNVYDNFGEKRITYLPYVASTSDGSYHPNAVSAEQPGFYQNGSSLISQDAAPYAQQVFENSPLRRILQSGSVGAGFQPGGHAKSYSARTNTLEDYIINWGEDASNQGYYQAGTLSVAEVNDEDGGKVLSFTDMDGKVVVKRELANQTVNGVFQPFFDTYYIYSNAGALIYIVSPKAIALMKQRGNWSLSQTDIVNMVFHFRYDQLGRIMEKYIPSSGLFYIVYDPLNRPVLLQDANLRAGNRWNYIKYDGKGHAISQGIYTDDNPNHIGLVNMQSYVNTLNYDIYYEGRNADASTGYYSNDVFPNTSTEPLAFSYYDDYDLNQDSNRDYSYINQGLNGEAIPTDLTRGLPTMVRKRSIGAGLADIWLIDVLFYDKEGRAVQKQSNNQLNYTAGIITDVSTSVYNFNGIVTSTKVIKLAGVASTTVETGYNYDHMYRLRSIKQGYNNAIPITLASYRYNELGQMIQKDLKPGGSNVDAELTLDGDDAINSGGVLNVKASSRITLKDGFYAANGSVFTAGIGFSSLQTLDYRYNIRGQLLSINNSQLTNDNGLTNNDNNDVFGMQFLYNQSDVNLGNTSYFSGKLSAIKWMSKDGNNINGQERSYSYSYDVLNRLTGSSYAEKRSATTNFDHNIGGFNEGGISYDENGNILTLQRNSSTPGTNAHVVMDNLLYTYSSSNPNQLLGIKDSGQSTAGFRIYSGGNAEGVYTYDAVGNLLTDPYKGLELSYNTINKIDRVRVTSGTGQYIQYTYGADGILLRKQVFKSGSPTLITDYIDGFVYNNTKPGNIEDLAYFSMPEGRVRNDQGVLKLEYVIADHQGNARMSIEDNGSGLALVRQENSYYAFGMTLPNSPVGRLSDENKHLYNGGAEWQNDYGDLPDYQQTFYRNYDAALGRFIGVDPLAINYASVTGYQYGNNNPIMFNDPLGDKGRPLPFENRADIDQGMGGGGGGGPLGNGRNFMEKWMAKLEAGRNQGPWSDFLGQNLPSDEQVKAKIAQSGTTINRSLYNTVLSGSTTLDFSKSGYIQVNTVYYENSLSVYGVDANLIRTGGGEGTMSRLWNSTIARVIVPDNVTVSGSFLAVLGIGMGGSYNLTLLTRGKDVGFHLNHTVSLKVGLEVGASWNVSNGWYIRDPRDATYDSLLGTGADVSGQFGVGLQGWASYSKEGIQWIGIAGGKGPGIGGSVGISNTKDGIW